MASISLQNVTKIFDRRTTAVANVTLDIADGEFLVLVGPSGCGKTTLLRLIAGLESPTAGDIRIAGRTVTGMSPRDRDVAMVFQDGVLYPHLSVYDNLAFPLRMRGIRKEQVGRRVAGVLETLDLAALADRKPASLSGGQRQRVALGRAVVREPAAFLFDEPLSSLDAALRLELREEIKTLHRRLRPTMLYVTHEQSEAMALGERVCVLREGQIQQVGRPSDVYERPANRFVAEFFGAPPMNFLAGTIRVVGQGSQTRSIAFGNAQPLSVAESAERTLRTGALQLEVAGGQVSLPASVSSLLGDGREEPVVVGVRPHDLSLEPVGQQDGGSFAGRVRLREPFGSRTDVHVVFPSGEKCIMSAPPHVQLDIDQPVRVYVRPERLHFFRPDGTALIRSVPARA
ncbi:MAG: ABC transporter ATP-binding protein [Planctomycetes bacterium]|nr:ABC transporter ATP-binding protein [Planctomycetota bacterium]